MVKGKRVYKKLYKEKYTCKNNFTHCKYGKVFLTEC